MLTNETIPALALAVFLLGLAIAFPFGALLVNALGPRPAYALAGAGCAATALLLTPLLSRRASARLPNTPGDGP